MVNSAVVSIAISGAITVAAAMRFPVLMNGLVLWAVMGTVLFVFVPCFMIRTVVSFRAAAMYFPVLVNGFVPRAVMRAILFVFVCFFMVSAIVSLTAAGTVMGVTVSVRKRERGGDTKHQSQGNHRGGDFACEFLCHGQIPPMNQNFVFYMTSVTYRENMKGR